MQGMTSKDFALTTIAVLLFCMGLPTSIAAEIQWSGFLSAIAGKTLQQDTRYNTGQTGYQGGIYGNELTYEQESVIGLQAQVQINDKMRSTVQIVGRGGENSRLSAEWAYLTFDINDSLDLNLGRYRLPTFYYSDFLEVGKAYYWIRPPPEVYVNPSSINGANLTYSSYLGEYDFSAQAWTGSGAAGFTEAAEVKITNNHGINATIGQDYWSIRGAYNQTDLELIANGVSLAKSRWAFLSLTTIADIKSWLLRAEYAVFKQDDLDGLVTWYTSVGYRILRLIPHLTYTQADANNELNIPASEVTTLGLAFDVDSNTTFKLEYLRRDPEPENLEATDLISFGVDVAF